MESFASAIFPVLVLNAVNWTVNNNKVTIAICSVGRNNPYNKRNAGIMGQGFFVVVRLSQDAKSRVI
jgi:hypothetical protein